MTKKDKIGQILFNLPAETMPNALALYIMKHLPDADEEGKFKEGGSNVLDFSSIPSSKDSDIATAFGVADHLSIITLGSTIKESIDKVGVDGEIKDGKIVDLVKDVVTKLPVNQIGLLIAIGIKALPEMASKRDVPDFHFSEGQLKKYLDEMME